MRKQRVDSPGNLARLTGLFEELAQGPAGRFLSVDVQAPGKGWVQATMQPMPTLNFYWPSDEFPPLTILLAGVDLPEGTLLQKWEPGLYAALYVPDPSPAVLASIADGLITKVYGCAPAYRFRGSFGSFT